MDLVIGRRRGVRRDRSMAVRDGARVLAVLSRDVLAVDASGCRRSARSRACRRRCRFLGFA